MEPENNTQLDKKQNEIEHHHVFGFHVKFPGCFLNHHAFVDPKLMWDFFCCLELRSAMTKGPRLPWSSVIPGDQDLDLRIPMIHDLWMILDDWMDFVFWSSDIESDPYWMIWFHDLIIRYWILEDVLWCKTKIVTSKVLLFHSGAWQLHTWDHPGQRSSTWQQAFYGENGSRWCCFETSLCGRSTLYTKINGIIHHHSSSLIILHHRWSSCIIIDPPPIMVYLNHDHDPD